MKLNKIFACMLVASAAWQGGYAQETKRNITLEETINLARAQSVNAAVALNELKAAYWEYRTFRADLLPEVNFSAKLPGYYKSYSPYQLDDGSYTFVRNNYMQMNGELSISQNIWFTGGTLSLNTSLDFLEPPHRAGALRGGQGRVPVGNRAGGHDCDKPLLQSADEQGERQCGQAESRQRREAL